MLLDLEEKTRVLVEDIVERSAIGRGAIFVLGLSSSEVAGGTIGKASSREIGQRIVKTILEVLEPKGIYLAVQGCEHLNRALVVERELAMAKDLEIVNVLPTLHAGGSGQLAAFDYMKDPVEVEEIIAQAGIDIGGYLYWYACEEGPSSSSSYYSRIRWCPCDCFGESS